MSEVRNQRLTESPFAALKRELSSPAADLSPPVSDFSAPADLWLNFFPVAVHVFTTPEAAEFDAEKWADSPARPTTAHYKLVP